MRNSHIAGIGDILVDLLEVTPSELRLAGLLFHSAAVVQEIQLLEEGSLRRIIVKMGLTRPDKSGSFAVAVPLSPGVEKVVFGAGADTLWKRPVTGPRARQRSARP